MRTKRFVDEKLEVEEVATSQVPADEEPKVAEKSKTGSACNARYVRVHKTASGGSPVVIVMKEGESAEILEQFTGFYKIRVLNSGHVGFVSSNYFKED